MAKSKSNASLAALAGFKKAMEEKENGSPVKKIDKKLDDSHSEAEINKPEKKVMVEPIIKKTEESPIKAENMKQNDSEIQTKKAPATQDNKKIKSETSVATKPAIKKEKIKIIESNN